MHKDANCSNSIIIFDAVNSNISYHFDFIL